MKQHLLLWACALACHSQTRGDPSSRIGEAFAPTPGATASPKAQDVVPQRLSGELAPSPWYDVAFEEGGVKSRVEAFRRPVVAPFSGKMALRIPVDDSVDVICARANAEDAASGMQAFLTSVSRGLRITRVGAPDVEIVASRPVLFGEVDYEPLSSAQSEHGQLKVAFATERDVPMYCFLDGAFYRHSFRRLVRELFSSDSRPTVSYTEVRLLRVDDRVVGYSRRTFQKERAGYLDQTKKTAFIVNGADDFLANDTSKVEHLDERNELLALSYVDKMNAKVVKQVNLRRLPGSRGRYSLDIKEDQAKRSFVLPGREKLLSQREVEVLVKQRILASGENEVKSFEYRPSESTSQGAEVTTRRVGSSGEIPRLGVARVSIEASGLSYEGFVDPAGVIAHLELAASSSTMGAFRLSEERVFVAGSLEPNAEAPQLP